MPADAIVLVGGWVLTPAKTERSRRTLPLAPEVVAALRRHQLRQAQERAKAAEVWAEQDLVFPNEIGRHTEPTGFMKRRYAELLKAAGVPRVTFHALRHSVATALLRKGTPVAAVSALLGHASIATTLNFYGHLVPGLAGQGVDTMRGLLWGPDDAPTSQPDRSTGSGGSQLQYELQYGAQLGEDEEQASSSIQ